MKEAPGPRAETISEGEQKFMRIQNSEKKYNVKNDDKEKQADKTTVLLNGQFNSDKERSDIGRYGVYRNNPSSTNRVLRSQVKWFAFKQSRNKIAVEEEQCQETRVVQRIDQQHVSEKNRRSNGAKLGDNNQHQRPKIEVEWPEYRESASDTFQEAETQASTTCKISNHGLSFKNVALTGTESTGENFVSSIIHQRRCSVS
ncbi:hypothetical protein WN55_04421 [Dufourea novaeangliae]|uniref:Uncharacterized protein n=1 Tax=Dufourea novaeangliae TaxID=178035 RepID=A0A154PM47_DUFNO|nr:hypothetical protein WN55_04421 [Dufourea novaeangliae]